MNMHWRGGGGIVGEEHTIARTLHPLATEVVSPHMLKRSSDRVSPLGGHSWHSAIIIIILIIITIIIISIIIMVQFPTPGIPQK